MNRIILAVEKMRLQIAKRVADGVVTQETVEKSRKNLDMGWEDYVAFQELKSCAVGTALTLEEAQTVYSYLGESVDHFNNQTVEVKAVCTKLLQELLGARIAAHV